MEDGVAIGVQDRLRPVEVRLVTADQEGDVTGGDVVRAAADRGVEHADVPGLRDVARGDGLGRARTAGGVQDEDGAFGHRGKQGTLGWGAGG
jgi:hypothetical protein